MNLQRGERRCSRRLAGCEERDESAELTPAAGPSFAAFRDEDGVPPSDSGRDNFLLFERGGGVLVREFGEGKRQDGRRSGRRGTFLGQMRVHELTGKRKRELVVLVSTNEVCLDKTNRSISGGLRNASEQRTYFIIH